MLELLQCSVADDRNVMQLQHIYNYNLSCAHSFINRFRGRLPPESADSVVPSAIESYIENDDDLYCMVVIGVLIVLCSVEHVL